MREKKEEKGQPLPQFVLSPETGRAGKAAAQPKIMIREKQLFCKLIKIKKSSRQMYEEWNGQCTSSRRACPVCGCRGSWQTHGRYERSIIDYESGQVVYRPKMLMNYRYDSVNCFTLILCGEPYLNNTLRKPVHEALRQRITVHYTFSGLSDAEVAEYVRHKLVCAGGAETIIEPSALSALHSHSQGNPRIVDNLMSDALLLGAQMDKKAIDPDTILAAVSGRNLV